MTEPMPMPPPEKQGELAVQHQSKGEKLFDLFVYGPMNVLGTFVLTIPVAWSMEHGYGKKYYEGFRSGLTKYLRLSEDSAGEAAKTTALMMGGNLMLIPVYWAEKRKENIVAGINRMLGDDKPRDRIVSEPQQDLASLGKSRALAWVMVFGTFKGLAHFSKQAAAKGAVATATESGNGFEFRFAEKMCDRFGWNKTRILENGLKDESRAFGYSRLAALDVFATLAAAALLYVGSRFFAKKRDEKIEFREYRATHPRAAGAATREEVSAVDDSQPAMAITGARAHEGALSEAPAKEAQMALN